MSHNAVETVMGAVVLVVAAFFLFFAYTTASVKVVRGNEYLARFDRVEGLRDGGDVRVAGIKVGTILSQTLDPKAVLAVVRVSLDPAIKLREDARASILTVGIFGDKYLAIEPGFEDKLIPPGGEIAITQPPVSLEGLIGKIAFGGGVDQPKGGANPPPK